MEIDSSYFAALKHLVHLLAFNILLEPLTYLMNTFLKIDFNQIKLHYVAIEGILCTRYRKPSFVHFPFSCDVIKNVKKLFSDSRKYDNDQVNKNYAGHSFEFVCMNYIDGNCIMSTC